MHPARLLAIMVLPGLLTLPATAQDLIFADGFESGDFSAWSSVTTGAGVPACVTGRAWHRGGRP